MLTITYSQYGLETFILIMVRITSFMYVAPFFGQTNTPQRTKLGFALILSFLVYMVLPEQTLAYSNNWDYATIIVKEAIAGVLMGFSVFICNSIVLFAGHVFDMEIGLTMATIYDPQTRTQVSVSGQLYQNLFMLIFIATGMHWYLLSALVDSFTAVPLDGLHIRAGLITVFIDFISDYFITGFRIALPVFASSMLVNIVLGIMTKVAPQMHMFSVGMQIKILAGLFIMFMTVTVISNITSNLFEQMKQIMVTVIRYIVP
ncbi:flagellar biosynthetic protein FliR [Lachnospiraceae bacterium 48-33]